MASFRTHYQNLKVERGASQRVISGAYKGLCLDWHPDRNPGDAEAEKNFKNIQNSYEVLRDPVARKKHDEWITRQEAKAEHSRTEKEETEQRRKEEKARKAQSRKNQEDTTNAFDVGVYKKHFAKAYREIETGNKGDGLWAMVYANTASKDEAKKEYINLRVQELHKQELIQKKRAKEARRLRKEKKEKEAELVRKREARRLRKEKKEKEAREWKEIEARRRKERKQMKELRAERLRKEKEAEPERLRKEKEAEAEQLKKEKEAESERLRTVRNSYDAMQHEFEKKGIKLRRTIWDRRYKVVYQDGSKDILDSRQELQELFDKIYTL